MIAETLAERVPMVRRETTGAEAARVIAEYRLSGLVVADAEGVPIAVVPGSQILGLVLPQYVRMNPTLPTRTTRRVPTSCAGRSITRPSAS